jgi:hypothetical protein
MRQVRQMQARSRSTSWGPRLWAAAAAIAALVMLPQQAPATAGAATAAKPVAGYSGLTSEQRANLLSIARDTWKFYGVDIGYGVEGLTFPYYGTGANASHPNLGLSQCHGCGGEDVVTPHASFLALDAAPQQAYANIQALRRLYPGVYGADGFFDAVDPVTGAVGHRDLVLDQSMIMAALDNALENRAIQRDFARDPVSWAARTYLSVETMSLR